MHDFAAGCWAATAFAVWWLERLATNSMELETSLNPLQKEFFYIGLMCVGIVLIAGIGRTFTYAHIGDVYGKDAEKLRRKMLAIKHIILLTIFGLGIWWQWIMVFR